MRRRPHEAYTRAIDARSYARVLRAFALALGMLFLAAPDGNAAPSSELTSIAAGAQHTIGLKSDGTVWAWGDNSFDQLGSGNSASSATPIQVLVGAGTPLTGVKSVAAGARFSIALKADGTVWAWGNNEFGALGQGNTTGTNACGAGQCSWYAVQVRLTAAPTYLANITEIAAGGRHAMALRADGSVWAWGNNSMGQLGQGSATGPNTCVAGSQCSWFAVQARLTNAPTYLSDVKQLAGGDDQSLALRADGTAWAWGENALGQLGQGSDVGPNTCGTTACSWLAVQVRLTNAPTYLTNVSSIAIGGDHAAALRADGTVWAWGNNDNGELSQGSAAGPNTCGATACSWLAIQARQTSAPTYLTNVISLAAGSSNIVALKADGSVWSWGLNASGQLAQGSATGPNTCGANSCSWFPVRAQVAAATFLGGVRALAVGGEHVAALKADGTLRSWGSNVAGQLGTGSAVGPDTCGVNACSWYAVASLYTRGTAWLSVHGGTYQAAAIRGDGTVWTWGINTTGQLGDGTLYEAHSPVQVLTGPGTPLTEVKQVALGRSNYALRADGSVWAWGGNFYAMLGQGSLSGPDSCGGTACSRYAVQVRTSNAPAFLVDVASIGSGLYHGIAVRSDGSVWNWGYDGSRQLGQGAPALDWCAGVNCSWLAVRAMAGAGPTYVANAIHAAGGGESTHVVLADGSVWGWGHNAYGLLAQGSAAPATSAYAVQARLTNAPSYVSNAVRLAAGRTDLSVDTPDAAAAMLASGAVYGWGINLNAELAQGSNVGPNTCATSACSWLAVQARLTNGPTYFANAADLSALRHGSVALRADGTAWVWGYGGSPLAQGPAGGPNCAALCSWFAIQAKRDAAPTFIADVTQVGASEDSGFVRKADGTIWSWGQNTYGGLGDCSITERFYEVQVQLICPAPTNTALPVISGTFVDGEVLSTTVGTWTGAPVRYTYQWRSCDSAGNNCSDIAGASGSTYELSVPDIGGTVRVVVTAYTSGGTGTATSLQSGVTAAHSAATNPNLAYITGFEHGATSASGGGAANALTGTPTVTTTSKRNGSFGLEINPAASQEVWESAVPGGGASAIRFAVRFATLPTASTEIFGAPDVDVAGVWR